MNDLFIIQGDARKIPLRDECVQCVVTSPPYWGLRKYAGAQDIVWGGNGHAHEWTHHKRFWDNRHASVTAATGEAAVKGETRDYRSEGIQSDFCECGAWRGGYGLEPTIEMYIAHTVEILREIRRVLRPDGVVFWNIGDSYASHRDSKVVPDSLRAGDGTAVSAGMAQNRNGKALAAQGIKHKDLCLIPERVAIAAQADGWWIRSIIIWAKPNPMPESCTDRPTDAYEHIIMLTKSERYFWDADAVREPSACPGRPNLDGGSAIQGSSHLSDNPRIAVEPRPSNASGRNMRNVWTFSTQPYKGAHFATFPEEIPRRCILAATSERGACAHCEAPWWRVVKATGAALGKSWVDHSKDSEQGVTRNTLPDDATDYRRETIGWEPSCKCSALVKPCLVLDPFGGSGTTARVAAELNRRAISLDLAYHDHAEKRTRNVQRRLVTA